MEGICLQQRRDCLDLHRFDRHGSETRGNRRVLVDPQHQPCDGLLLKTFGFRACDRIFAHGNEQARRNGYSHWSDPLRVCPVETWSTRHDRAWDHGSRRVLNINVEVPVETCPKTGIVARSAAKVSFRMVTSSSRWGILLQRCGKSKRTRAANGRIDVQGEIRGPSLPDHLVAIRACHGSANPRWSRPGVYGCGKNRQ